MLYNPAERKLLKSCPWRDLLLNKSGNICINVILRRVCETVVVVEEQEVLHILSVSVSLVIQHTKSMRIIISSYVFSAAVLILQHVTNGTIFGEKVIEHNVYPPLIKRLSESFLIPSKNSARYHKYIWVFM
jgi:hypothetical protein